MTIEDRLRDAIADRTSSVDVDERSGLEQIARKLDAAQGGDMTVDLRSPNTRWLLAGAAAAVLMIAAIGVVLLRNGGSGTDVEIDPTDAAQQPSTTDTPETTDTADTTDTTQETSTTSTTGEAGSGPAGTAAPPRSPGGADPVEQQAVWPRPSSDVRFNDPVAAARSFARYYALFDDPIVGGFRQGDSRSGEVPVQAFRDGPETTVLVRQGDGDHWFVIGSVAPDITVSRPSAGDTLSCPLVTSGTALAFEGTVQVNIDAYQPDGRRVEVGKGFVTGSGAPPAGPFSGEINCKPPSGGVERYGIVRYWTDDASGEREGPLQVAAFPVRLP